MKDKEFSISFVPLLFLVFKNAYHIAACEKKLVAYYFTQEKGIFTHTPFPPPPPPPPCFMARYNLHPPLPVAIRAWSSHAEFHGIHSYI